MGLYDELTEEIAAAFDDDLADAVSTFAGVQIVKGNYDPITNSSNDTVINYSGRGVFSDYDYKLVDGESILATDKNLIALQAEVSDIPKVDDTIDNIFKVISVKSDPVNATWNIQLRS